MAERRPRSSAALTPSMVVPPGEQTSSLRTSGCLPVSRTILAAPSIDCAASFMESALDRPFRTPASAIASIIWYMKAGELPAMPVMASISDSFTSAASPTALRIPLTRLLSSDVRESSQQYPIAPSRTMQQWLGMTLTILASGTYCFRRSVDSPATMLTRIFPLRSSPSSKTSPTFFGLTARTTISDSLQRLFASPSTAIPCSAATLARVVSDGAHAAISDAE